MDRRWTLGGPSVDRRWTVATGGQGPGKGDNWLAGSREGGQLAGRAQGRRTTGRQGPGKTYNPKEGGQLADRPREGGPIFSFLMLLDVYVSQRSWPCVQHLAALPSLLPFFPHKQNYDQGAQ